MAWTPEGASERDPAMAEPVVIVDYDPSWPQQFAELRERLMSVLAGVVVGIEHVGSTAVPGLAAKPIIDIDVVIPDWYLLPTVIERLAMLGYSHRGDLGIAGREAFEQPPDLPRHHLYVCAADADELRRHLRLRDYLRAHPEAARAYEQLKRRAARVFPNDLEAYTEAKTSFVMGLLRSASEEEGAEGNGFRS